LAGKGKRTKLIAVALLGAVMVLFLADPEFIERQQTTANPTDNSAQSRKAMFAAGIEMIKDYPLGGGGRTFHVLGPRYIPEITADAKTGERSPHNTLIQLATDWGIHGAVLYFVFMFMTFRLLHRVRKRLRGESWYYYRSLTIETALIGTLVASLFSSRLYGESIYWMCALAYSLHRLQSTELEGLSQQAATVPADPSVRGVAEPAMARRRANA
jgi:O-antigen ligase